MRYIAIHNENGKPTRVKYIHSKHLRDAITEVKRDKDFCKLDFNILNQDLTTVYYPERKRIS